MCLSEETLLSDFVFVKTHFSQNLHAKMDPLPISTLFNFHPDTVQSVKKEFNLDQPGRMEEAIDILDDWVKKQGHFVKKDFLRGYLERNILSTKGSIERAKLRLDKFCSYKTLMPKFFVYNVDENTFADLKTCMYHALLPTLTPDFNRVVMFKLLNVDDVDSELVLKYFKYTFVAAEYGRNHDYCCGFVLILDLRDISILKLVAKINVIDFRHFFTFLMEGCGMRLTGTHFITPSKTVDAIVSIFKSVLSPKLGKRVRVHKTTDTLYEHVPKYILPKEYGGTERSMKTLHDEWFKIFTSKEHNKYLQGIEKATTNESLREKGMFDEEYIGMLGSFRHLCVD